MVPCTMASTSIPATAIGSKPTGVNIEKRPPTSSGITNVSYPSLLASSRKAPRDLSVVAYILSFAPSLPYFFSKCALRILKAIAGSVVVPDFDITFYTYIFIANKLHEVFMYEPLILLPTK